MHLRIFGLVFSLFCAFSAVSQLNEYARFRNIETKEFGHLSIHSQIWMEDGSFWAATESGIVHHNGYQAKDFDASKDGTGTVVSKNIVRLNKIAEDEIWISYRDTCVLTLLNPKSQEFTHYYVDELLTEGKLTSLIVKVEKDNNGQLWLCTWGVGLVRWSENGEGNKSFIFNDGNFERKKAGVFVKDIVIRKDNLFLVTFFHEYVGELSFPGIFDPETEAFERIPIRNIIQNSTDNTELRGFLETCVKIVHFVHQDVNGNYWLGTYSGLVFLDLEHQQIQRVYSEEENGHFQNQVNVLECIEFNDHLWIATSNKGMMVVNINTKEAIFHVSDAINSNSIYSNKIHGISIDPHQNIWVADGKGVLSIYTPFIHNFKVMYWKDMNLDYSNRSAQNIPVNQLLVKDSRNVFVSSKKGVLKLDYHTMETSKFYDTGHIEKKERWKRGIENMKLLGDKLMVVHDVHPGLLDIESGELYSEISNSQFGGIGFKHEPKIQAPYFFRNARGIGGAPSITQYNWKERKEVLITGDSIPGKISGAFAFVTNSGQWITSEDAGRFYLIDTLGADEWKLFSPSRKESFFPDSTVSCVLIQDNNEILIGTSSALYIFDEITYEYTDVSDRLGLNKNEGVNSMIKDDNGVVWLALNNEILRWDPVTDETFRYGEEMGVAVSDFLPAIAQRDELGNLYFVAMYGILVFHPDDVKIPVQTFDLGVSEVKVHEKILEKTELSNLLKGDKKFHWSDNYIEFTFHTNQVFQLSPHRFQYKLEGLNEKWISCGTTNHVRFDNLQHGDYELKFKGVNGLGIESNVYSIPFSIKRPFWLTWWFISVLVVSAICMIYLLVKWRMSTLKKRQLVLERTVEERTAEVVEQKKEADRQRAEAEHQKDIVEEKQQEITDSITYAKRIQDAILPSEELIQKYLPLSFVMYRPKDIVAGDFYWMEALSEDEVIFAVADCTGHGVPGAMVSVVCNNALNRSVREFGIKNPAQLLDSTRELVIEQFEQNVAEAATERDETIKDGMDISVCYVNRKTNQMIWAGANNPIWIVRNEELIEIKGNKQPVGKFESNVPFDSHEIKTLPNDRFYIFSDGYADQFGGDKGKKFKSSSLKKLLLSIHHDPIKTQHMTLEDEFDKWKGDYEQLDDVCVIGFQI